MALGILLLHTSFACRSFDAAGDGYGRSEGFASIVVVPMSSSSGLPYAVVHGSAINQVTSAFTTPCISVSKERTELLLDSVISIPHLGMLCSHTLTPGE